MIPKADQTRFPRRVYVPDTKPQGGLTGKRRFIRGSHIDGTPYPVLQVEYTEFVTTSENRPGRWVCQWRDATPEDVTEEVV